MRLEFVIDGREVALDRSPLDSLADVLRSLSLPVDDRTLVTVEDDLVRAGDVPVIHARGASVRTLQGLSSEPLLKRIHAAAGAVSESRRSPIAMAAYAITRPGTLGDGEDVDTILAPFAPDGVLPRVADLIRRELARSRVATPDRKSTRSKSTRSKSARSKSTRSKSTRSKSTRSTAVRRKAARSARSGR